MSSSPVEEYELPPPTTAIDFFSFIPLMEEVIEIGVKDEEKDEKCVGMLLLEVMELTVIPELLMLLVVVLPKEWFGCCIVP